MLRATPRVLLRLTCALVLAVQTAVIVPPAAVAAPLEETPQTAPLLSAVPEVGTVGPSDTDPRDYLRVVLAAGDYLSLDLSSTHPTIDLDLRVYAGETNAESAIVTRSDKSDTASESIRYLVPPSAEGTYTIEITAPYALVDPYEWTLQWSKAPVKAPRLYGLDRYETSYAISRSSFATAPACVIASGASFPDALAASGLAGQLGGPVLLTRPTGDLHRGLVAEIERLGVTKIYIVGGTAAVSAEVATALTAQFPATSPERIPGGSRYETAGLVAQKIHELKGGPASTPYAFVVRGDAFADALAVAPFAFAEKIPVLLTNPTALNEHTRDVLDDQNVGKAIIAGGVGAVSAPTMAQIATWTDTAPERWYGGTRYATSVDVATEGIAEFGWTDAWTTVGVATGVSFPDALSGGAACGVYGGPLLLTNSASLSDECRLALEGNAISIDRVLLFGGTAALSTAVQSAIEGIVP